MNHKQTITHRVADGNAVLADLALRSHSGMTAFSARPDAPVLPFVERRPSQIARLRLLATGGIRGDRQGRQASSRRHPAVVAGAGPAC